MEQELVIRICFKSGAVSEERGTEDQIHLLFEDDTDQLIDYVMSFQNWEGGEIAVFQHEGDERWAGLTY